MSKPNSELPENVALVRQIIKEESVPRVASAPVSASPVMSSRGENVDEVRRILNEESASLVAPAPLRPGEPAPARSQSVEEVRRIVQEESGMGQSVAERLARQREATQSANATRPVIKGTPR